MPILTGIDEACVILSSMVTYAAARGSTIPDAMMEYANGGGKDRRRKVEKLFDESICAVLAAIAEREDIDCETRKAIERALAWHSDK
mgnify:CR=1 FL=1